MNVVMDILIGIIMSCIIYVLAQSVSRSVTSDIEGDDKTQKIFVIDFVIGIVCLFMALTIFRKSQFKNRALKIATFFGGGWLILNSVVFNWDCLSDATRIVLIGITLLIMVYYVYKKSSEQTEQTKKAKAK